MGVSGCFHLRSRLALVGEELADNGGADGRLR